MEIPQVKKISPKQARAYAAMTVALLLAGAACGGAETAEPPATSAAVPNTAPSTILPPQTTQPTTTAPPAAPTTVPAPPTTSPPSEEDQAKQAVIDAAKNAWYVFNEAKLDPTNTEKVAAALAMHSGAASNQVAEILGRYAATNQRSVTLPTAPANVEIYRGSVDVDIAVGTATVEVCELASNTLVAAADGIDRVVNDDITSYHERATFVLENGAWLRTDVEQLQRFEGATSCERS
jgi:hypothetical protein